MLCTIPPEVLGEVFYLTIQGSISNINDSLFPWGLGLVCKEWRHAFITHAKLWASITLDLGCLTTNVSLKKLLRRFLLCSRNHLLDIILCIPHVENPEPFTSIWKAFLSCSCRWRTIYVRGAKEPIFDLATCKGNLQVLQSLTLTVQFNLEHDAFIDAPKLTQFNLPQIIGFAPRRWSMPWSQLSQVCFAMDEMSGDELKFALESLPAIQELRLLANGFDEPYHLTPFPPISLEHLHILKVTYPHILQVIKAPSLIELCMETSSELYPVDADGGDNFGFYREILDNFIQVSSCRIRKICLEGFEIGHLEPLIDSFPYLEELLIEESSCIELLQMLTDDDGEDAIAFPKLRVLTLVGDPGYVDDELDTITNILEARNGSPSVAVVPLEKIIIQLPTMGHVFDHSYEPIPIALQDAILEWDPFEVDVQIEHIQATNMFCWPTCTTGIVAE